MEGNGNGEAGEDEARRVKQREANGVTSAERAFDQQAKRRQRVFPIDQTTRPEIRKAVTTFSSGNRP